jgi:hypothetical protein
VAANGTELFVGGPYFTSAGGKPSSRIALWHIPHALCASRSERLLTLSWPGTGTNFLLEACSGLSEKAWAEVRQGPAEAGNQLVVTQAIAGQTEFYRLRRKPPLP